MNVLSPRSGLLMPGPAIVHPAIHVFTSVNFSRHVARKDE
jgi:hypothetical protein